MRYLLVALALLLSPLYAAPRNIATAPTSFYVDNAGNDANDGLTRATAMQHFCATVSNIYDNWDFRGFQPFVYPHAGQLYNEMCGFGGVPVGVSAIIIAPDDPSNPNIPGLFTNSAAAPYVRTCTPPGCGNSSVATRQWCDNFGDLSILIYYSVTFADCNHWNVDGGAAVIMHLTSTGDFFGTNMTISGRGGNDVGFYIDGPGILTIGGGFQVNGQFSYPIKCLKGCNLSISGNQFYQFSNVVAPYYLAAGSHANIQASYTLGTSAIFTGSSYIGGYSSAVVGVVPPSGSGMPAWVTNNGMICGAPC